MRAPTTGGGTEGSTSRIHAACRNLRSLHGGTIRDGNATPSAVAGTMRIRRLHPNVCAEPTGSSTDDSPPFARRPRNRWRKVQATSTRSSRHGGATRSTRRYMPVTSTLAPLWQRQNDASCAPAGRRRTTAASPTPVAADRRDPYAFACVPSAPIRGTRCTRPREESRPLDQIPDPGVSLEPQLLTCTGHGCRVGCGDEVDRVVDAIDEHRR